MAYSWLSLAEAKRQLASKLADPGMVRWTAAELVLYLREALRVWNCLTFSATTEFVFNVQPSIGPLFEPTWMSLGTLTGSPRLRTVTDTDVYTLMQYHLGEPPSGGVWTGTSQFSITDLSQALQRYRDELIQASNCNVVNIGLPYIPNDTRILLPDTALDVLRMRFVPVPDKGAPVTLFRDDKLAEQGFDVDAVQTTPGMPSEYNVADGPSLALDVNVGPAIPGGYDAMVLMAGAPLTPPAASLLNIPDDFAWVAKYGALASNLGRESEATDRPRAEFCQKRFEEGVKLMQNTPWIQLVRINNVPGDTPSVIELDGYAPEWDSGVADEQSVVTCGMDTFTVMPSETDVLSVTMTVLGNAPVPVLDTDFLQISRDVWVSILDYAQFLALFKLGGFEWSGAKELEASFVKAAEATNGRLSKLGLFSDVLNNQGQREEMKQERFKKEEQ